jgi:DNA sulfur modification protein DndD
MSRIQIHSVEVKDYRQFRGKQRIELETDDKKNINVIEGENGSGKSNLLNAITFCLYDTEEHLEESKEEGLNVYPYANRDRLEDLDEGEELNGYVEVRFGRDRPEYRFKRSFITAKKGENEFSDASDDLTLQRKEGTDWDIKNDPNAHLNQILPVDVRYYYLFDGERLDTFFEEEYAEKVKKGIVDVSHIDLLERAEQHLERVRDQIQDKDDFSGKEDEIREKLNKKRDELDELKHEKEDIVSNLNKTRRLIKQKKSKLEDSDDKYVRSKQEQRSKAKDRLKSLRSRKEDLQDQSGNVLAEAAPIVYCYDALDFTLDQINELHEKGKLPPRIQDYFIRELLEEGECICGETIEEEHEHELNELLEEVETGIDEDKNLEGKSEIPHIQDVGTEKVSQLLDLRQQIRDVEEEIDETETEINEITEELKQYDTSDEDIDVDAIEDQLKDLEDREEKLEDQKENIVKDIALKQDEVNKKDEELTEELKKKEKHQDLVKKLEFMEQSIDHVNDIQETVLTEIRSQAQEKIEEYFNQLIWKDEEYEIVLEEDYTIRVLDEFGMDKIGSLSAGEKQVLALSFMSALTSISGFEAPIVIDTPLGRISSEPRNRIAENIPDYIEGTQLTFLMTDSEYTTQVESRMKDSISNEYLLNNSGLKTEVVER